MGRTDRTPDQQLHCETGVRKASGLEAEAALRTWRCRAALAGRLSSDSGRLGVAQRPPSMRGKQLATRERFDLAQERLVPHRKAATFMPAHEAAFAPAGGVRQEYSPVLNSTGKAGWIDQPIAGALEMRPGARERPVFRSIGKPGAHRIQEDVSRRGIQMSVIHRKGREPALPEAASPPFPAVDHGRIPPVGDGHRSAEPSWIRRHGDEVKVIRQQAVRPDSNPFLLALLRQQVAVNPVVEWAKERRLAPVSSLGHVMRQARNYEPRDPCHTS